MEELSGGALNTGGDNDDVSTPTEFQQLPPEMVTAVLECLESCPESMLACRLVSPQFKLLIDEILEKRQISLWNWSKACGEGNPMTAPGPVKRPALTGKIFVEASDIDKFLKETKDHQENGLNPFPSRGIYIRRTRTAPTYPFPPVPLRSITISADQEGGLGNITMRAISFFEAQDKANPNDLDLSTPKVVELVQPFGIHLTSMIMEFGLVKSLTAVPELGTMLEHVPHLQYLMLKKIRIEAKKGEPPKEDFEFPSLQYLKTLKVIQCSGINLAMLRSYHSQVESLQLINTRDYWFPHFEKLRVENDGKIFGRLRELKLGEFENSSEFDYLTTFLQACPQPFQKLERLAIHYCMVQDFAKSPEKMFQVLEHLPKLKEFSVGNSGSTSFVLDPEEERAPLKFKCASGSLISIGLPIQFIRYPKIVQKILQNVPSVREVKFLDCNRNPDDSIEKVLQLPEGIRATDLVQELLTMEGFRRIVRVVVLELYGEKLTTLCTAVRKDDKIFVLS